MAYSASSGDRANNADGSIVIGTSVDTGGINTGLKKIHKAWNNLQLVTKGVLGIGLIKFSKSAVNAASDLQEVQNIVDVAFGEMSYKMENFADTAIEKFGMSELAAKQTGGSFMAMGKSMGLSLEEASDMSISLTGLTADMASFYNISQDYARVAMSAVYTGETETLKRYGIVLTEANLQQYANAQGINQSVKAMDARDKAILRYMYILEATKDMQGDFARTSGSWANQVRLLQQQWTLFLNVVGSGLVTVLTPLLQMLNRLIQAVTQFAKVIGDALMKIFKLKPQSLTDAADGTAAAMGGVADATEDAADKASNLAKSTKKAKEEAKKALEPFDELNNLSSDKDETKPKTGSGSGSGVAGGGVGLEMPPVDSSAFEKSIKDILSSVDNLFDLGRLISTTLENALRSINWNKIYEKARGFGKGLAEFLNGLITPGLFGAVGSTIASALNTAIYAALSFGLNFDWANLGLSLAAGVNEFFATFDFGALADTIDAWVQGLYTMVVTFIKNVDWSKIWDGVKDFMSHIDLDTIEIVVGFITIKGLLGRLKKAFIGVPGLISGIVKDSMEKAFGASSLSGIIKNALVPRLSTGLSAAFTTLKAGGGLNKTITTFFTGITGSWNTGALITQILGIGVALGGVVLIVKNFFDMWKDGFSWLNEAFLALGAVILGVGLVIAGVPLAWAAAVAAIVAVVATLVIVIKDHWEDIKKTFKPAGQWFDTNVIQPAVTLFTNLWTTIKTVFTNLWNDIVAIFTSAATWFNTIVIQPIVNWFKSFWQTIKDIFNTLWIIIKAIWIVASTWFYNTVIAPIVSRFKTLKTNIENAFKTAWALVMIVWKVVSNWFNTHVTTPVKKLFDTLKTNIKNVFSTAWSNIKNVWNGVSNWFTTHVTQPIASAFNKMWGTIKVVINSMISGVERLLNSIIGGINIFLGGLETVGKAAAAITGSNYSGITKIQTVSLPRLAKGAVIPPNKEFMAILGDQKHGTNIEAPLDTIVQAFNQAGGKSSEEELALLREQNRLLSQLLAKDVTINSRDIFNSTRSEAQDFFDRNGVSPYPV